MPEPDWPVRPPCWAFTRGRWHQGRVLSTQPIPGRTMHGWDPTVEYWLVATDDAHRDYVPTHHLVVGEDGVRPEEPGVAPEDWEPDPEEPGFLG